MLTNKLVFDITQLKPGTPVFIKNTKSSFKCYYAIIINANESMLKFISYDKQEDYESIVNIDSVRNGDIKILRVGILDHDNKDIKLEDPSADF